MIKQQFVRFAVVGVVCTLVSYGVFYGLYEFFKVHYILSSAIGFFSGLLIGYPCNKLWTFGVQEELSKFVVKYYVVYIVSLVLGLVVLEVLVSGLGIDPKLANVITIGCTTCTNFMGTKYWVFKV